MKKGSFLIEVVVAISLVIILGNIVVSNSYMLINNKEVEKWSEIHTAVLSHITMIKGKCRNSPPTNINDIKTWTVDNEIFMENHIVSFTESCEKKNDFLYELTATATFKGKTITKKSMLSF